MRALLVAVFVLAPMVSRADGEALTVLASLGGHIIASPPTSDHVDSKPPGPAALATIAYRVTPHLAIGLHGGLARSRRSTSYAGTIFAHSDHLTQLSIDAGPVLHAEVEHAWFDVWAGAHTTRTTDGYHMCVRADCTSTTLPATWDSTPAAGAAVGANILTIGPNCVDLVFEGALGRGGYGAAGVGVAYRRR